VHAHGAGGGAIAAGLLGYGLAWVATAAALAGVRAGSAEPASDRLDALAGLAGRRPRAALALALAALLWAGLPGTFSLAVRGELWRAAEAPAGLVLLVVAGGGFLRILAVARLIRGLYFRSAPAAASGAPDEAPAPRPIPLPRLALGITPRWALAFLAALGLEFGLGLFAPGLAAGLRAVAGAVAGG
jgi:formate hydrogenlyase subunit 3/multisubunit Na+/H+ antiporter MnhD subunit